MHIALCNKYFSYNIQKVSGSGAYDALPLHNTYILHIGQIQLPPKQEQTSVKWANLFLIQF